MSHPTRGLLRLLLLLGLFMMLVQVHRSLGAALANELRTHGHSPSDIATIVSAMFLASALFQLPAGMLFDRFGARLTLGGMGLVAVAGVFVFALSDSIAGLTTGRFLIGVGHGGTIAGIYMLALNWVPADRVATATGGVVAIAGGLGGVLATAPLVLALEHIGHQTTFLGVGCATALVTLAIGLLVRDAPPGEATGRPAVPETFSESLRGLLAVAMTRRLWPLYAMATCFSVPFHAIGGLWAGPYLHDVHALPNEQAGLAVLVMVLAFHLGNLGYGPVERALRTHKWTIIGGVAVMVCALLILASSPGLGTASAITLLVLFCLATPFYPVLAAHCRRFVPLSRAGRAIACINLMGLTTVFAMQKLTGAVVDAGRDSDGTTTELGYRLVFGLMALLLVLAVIGYSRARDGDASAAQQRAP